MTDADRFGCLWCRHSEQRYERSSANARLSTVLWCELQQQRALTPCPGYEREPGTEGDDD